MYELAGRPKSAVTSIVWQQHLLRHARQSSAFLAGTISELAHCHRLGNRIYAGTGTQRAGIFIDLPYLDLSGAVAGVAFVFERIEPLTVTVHALMRMVGSDAAIINPAASVAFGAGFWLAFK